MTGIVDFSIFPHLGHELMPRNDGSRRKLGGWHRGSGVAIDDEAAIRATNGTADVVSERHWKLRSPCTTYGASSPLA